MADKDEKPYRLTVVNHEGRATTTEFSGWGAETYADRAFNEEIRKANTFFALVVDYSGSHRRRFVNPAFKSESL